MADWEKLADWWLDEIEEDPIYQLDVIPLALELIGRSAGVIVDLGCGEGQVMRSLESAVLGTDISQTLLGRARSAGSVVRGRLPDLGWLRAEAVDAAYAVLVIEHLRDLTIFDAVFRVVRSGGLLVVVANHPAFTAAEAGPIHDQSDGEFLWRWGDYFEEARISMPADGEDSVEFYHRPLGEILNAASAAGWRLDHLAEKGFSRAAIEARPGYAGQEQMPRLLGLRWVKPATDCIHDHHSR